MRRNSEGADDAVVVADGVADPHERAPHRLPQGISGHDGVGEALGVGVAVGPCRTGMGTLRSPASRSAASPGRPGLDDDTRSPVSRQCPKTCPNVCARTDTRWTQWTR